MFKNQFMYNITREQAAVMLNISTRSVDRYIKSWKLRSKKDWKIVYIHSTDIDNIVNPNQKQKIIIRETEDKIETKEISKPSKEIFVIYENLKNEIIKKDEEIKLLNQEIWKMQEVLKNSISMIEFKKSQYLLEESKNSLTQDLEITKKELEIKNKEVKEEKNLNYILLSSIIILIILLWVVWFVKI